MNPDLFLAILSMDSYNRGYGANVGGLGEAGTIGAASIRPFEIDEQQGWEAAGFYAIAYDWNGETVISYRGTNFEFDSVFEFLGSPIYNDVFKGWTLGAWFSSVSQGQLAANENSLTSIAA